MYFSLIIESLAGLHLLLFHFYSSQLVLLRQPLLHSTSNICMRVTTGESAKPFAKTAKVSGHQTKINQLKDGNVQNAPLNSAVFTQVISCKLKIFGVATSVIDLIVMLSCKCFIRICCHFKTFGFQTACCNPGQSQAARNNCYETQ